MNPTVRSIVAVLLGAFVAFVLITAIESISSAIYFPKDVDRNDMEALKALMPTLPLGAKLLVLAAYAVGTLAGSWLAAWFARRARLVHAMIVGGLFLVGDIMNLMELPHPLWMALTSLAIFPVCAFVGARLAGVPPDQAVVTL